MENLSFKHKFKANNRQINHIISVCVFIKNNIKNVRDLLYHTTLFLSNIMFVKVTSLFQNMQKSL